MENYNPYSWVKDQGSHTYTFQSSRPELTEENAREMKIGIQHHLDRDREVRINLEHVTTLPNETVSMLVDSLKTKSSCGFRNEKIVLDHTNTEIREKLRIMNFDRFFEYRG